MVREFSPHSTIAIGGHVAATPGLEDMIDADHIVRGEGIAWMRRFLGEDVDAPIQHPEIVSGLETRIMGFNLPEKEGRRRPPSFLPSGVPWDATSARPRHFSAARESS